MKPKLFTKCYFCRKTIWIPWYSSVFHGGCFNQRLNELHDQGVKIVNTESNNEERREKLNKILEEINFLMELSQE